MKNKKIQKNTLLLILVVIFETVLIKNFQYKMLPAKFFFDSGTILNSMSSIASIIGLDNSYNYAVHLFNRVNFFHFTTLQQWSNFIAIIFTPIVVYFLNKNKQYKLHQLIFVIASVALLNIYVFNLSKDIIQFVYFLILYLILISKLKNSTKLVLCCIVLLYEAVNFRIYYAIMAMVMVTIYYIYVLNIKNKKLNKRNVIKIILMFMIAFFGEVFFIQLISKSNYDSILLARYGVNANRLDYYNSVTIINDMLGQNTNFIIFIGNYLINFIRMNIPIELLPKSIIYTPFILYQIYIIIQVSKNIKNINDKNILFIDTIISFIMISVIFEPDFGSFIRHESVLFLLLLELTKMNSNDKIKS